MDLLWEVEDHLISEKVGDRFQRSSRTWDWSRAGQCSWPLLYNMYQVHSHLARHSLILINIVIRNLLVVLAAQVLVGLDPSFAELSGFDGHGARVDLAFRSMMHTRHNPRVVDAQISEIATRTTRFKS